MPADNAMDAFRHALKNVPSEWLTGDGPLAVLVQMEAALNEIHERMTTLAVERDEARREAAEALAIIQRLTIDPRPLTTAEAAHGLTTTPASARAGICGRIIHTHELGAVEVHRRCPHPAGHTGPCVDAVGDGGSNG